MTELKQSLNSVDTWLNSLLRQGLETLPFVASLLEQINPYDPMIPNLPKYKIVKFDPVNYSLAFEKMCLLHKGKYGENDNLFC